MQHKTVSSQSHKREPQLTHELGQTLTLHYLANKGADLHSVDKDKHTALHWAAYQNHPDSVLYLLNHRADPNAADASRYRPFVFILGHKRYSYEHRSTALHWAAIRGHLEVCQILVDHGARIDFKDAHGYTPMILSASFPALQNLFKRSQSRPLPFMVCFDE